MYNTCGYIAKKELGTSILGCQPIDGVLGVLSSNQINIATFFHQMGDTHIYSGIVTLTLATLL